MEKITQLMPGYRVNEYKLILPLPEAIWQKVSRLQSEFSEKYKTPFSRTSRPHILLSQFTTWQMMEEKILHRMQSIAFGLTPFKIELDGFDSYPSHTIFIKVASRQSVKEMVREVKDGQRLMKMNQQAKPFFSDDPHISIATRLKPWQYEAGWNEFSHRQFTGRFIADHILLLKRDEGSRSAFQVVKRFEMLNLPVVTRQGSLFV